MISLVSLLPYRSLRRRPSPSPRVSGQAIGDRSSTIKSLPPLLHVASELDLDDAAGWTSLGVAARRVIDGLIQSRELSWRFRLEPEDPPVVVARTLAVAWRQITALPGHSHHRM